MRYQVLNQRDRAAARFSFRASLKRLARRLCTALRFGRDSRRPVDSSTREVIEELGAMARGVDWRKRRGTGAPTTSYIRIGRDGHKHEFIVGTTAYGNGGAPRGGHKPDTVIEVETGDSDQAGSTK